MTRLWKLLLAFLIAGLLVVVLFYAYFLLEGRDFLIQTIESSLGVPVKSSRVYLELPPKVVMRDVEIGDQISIAQAQFIPSILGLIRGGLIFNELKLVQPRLIIRRLPKNIYDFGLKGADQVPMIYIPYIDISDGVIEFRDETMAEDEPFVIRLSQWVVRINRSNPLAPGRLEIFSQGYLLAGNNRQIGQMEMDGWADFLAKDMDARFFLSNVRLPYLLPYNKRFFKKELISGNLRFSSRLNSRKNRLNADCRLEFFDIAFKEGLTPMAESDDLAIFTIMAFDAMLESQKQAAFDFSITTKMDAPKFENVRFSGTFMKTKIEASFKNPPEETAQEISKIGEQIESFGQAFGQLFKKK